MKDKLKKYIKEIIIFTITLAIAMNVVSFYRAQDLNKNDLDIKSFKLLDGSEYNIKTDKPLVIHFWATWCPTCKLEASNIEKLSKDYEVITIAVQSGSEEEIKEYLKSNDLTFNVVNDENAFYSSKFNIKVFPTTLIYNKEKNLEFSEVGYTTTVGLYTRMSVVK
ncbi:MULTISPECIES: redoxin domain-containing protein [Arcobacteraceae]|uniref:Protein disulfide oxidoreductase n=1 Tax=Poseidonibacter parvus TaxID=1850254 RepID=A0A1P8KNJ3_9BACT|nr:MULTISPECIES: redoxin domain-containing protein [Arcobacteraceae]APW66111.1 protein disulfide oxidoreductase [Poseidonibacter parvus]